jgi:hypothetical protein
MNRMLVLLDHALVRYIVTATVSLIVAILLFHIAGSVAELTKSSATTGITVQAGGAFAGFVITFTMSERFMNKTEALRKTARFNTILYVVKKPKNFSRREGQFTCTGYFYNRETNEKRESNLSPHWEAGVLTLDFLGVRPNELIGAKIDLGDRVWHIDDFNPMVYRVEVKDQD